MIEVTETNLGHNMKMYMFDTSCSTDTVTVTYQYTIIFIPEAFKNDWLFWFDVVATTKIGSVDEALDEVAWMETRPHGVVVPKPDCPFAAIKNAEVVENVPAGLRMAEVTAKSGMLESDEVADTERRAHGLEVPIAVRAMLSTMKYTELVVLTTNAGVVVLPLTFTERVPHGVVDAIPTPRLRTLLAPAACA